MTARQMLKGKYPSGKILLCSKGRYDFGRDEFAYCICDDGTQYNIKVLSAVHPREYSVPYGAEITVKTLEMAILYNEWRARVIEDKKRRGEL